MGREAILVLRDFVGCASLELDGKVPKDDIVVRQGLAPEQVLSCLAVHVPATPMMIDDSRIGVGTVLSKMLLWAMNGDCCGCL